VLFAAQEVATMIPNPADTAAAKLGNARMSFPERRWRMAKAPGQHHRDGQHQPGDVEAEVLRVADPQLRDGSAIEHYLEGHDQRHSQNQVALRAEMEDPTARHPEGH
jgi:hypothetical protein